MEKKPEALNDEALKQVSGGTLETIEDQRGLPFVPKDRYQLDHGDDVWVHETPNDFEKLHVLEPGTYRVYWAVCSDEGNHADN